MQLLIQILFIGFFHFSNNSVDSSLIEWNADRKLTWDDFKGRPNKSSPNAALTATNINFDYSYSSDLGFKFHIRCQFDKNNSWGRVKNDYILSHEQGHFDIAEIHARKLYKALKNFKPSKRNGEKEVNNIYQKIMEELNATQKEYDRETDFSIDKMEQGKWLIKVNEELKSLDAYAGYH